MATNFNGIRWITPPSRLADAIDRYGERVLVAVAAVAGRMATVMQNSAKKDAPWTDRTGNARSGLFGTVEVAQNTVILYLSHGPIVDYGVFLELAHGGRYAIIMRTMERHLPELNSMLQDIFG